MRAGSTGTGADRAAAGAAAAAPAAGPALPPHEPVAERAVIAVLLISPDAAHGGGHQHRVHAHYLRVTISDASPAAGPSPGAEGGG